MIVECKMDILDFATQMFKLITVRNIPKFKDRANWSRATF